MNGLDRLIAAVAPEWGLHRARARAQLALVRAYEGAQQSRRTDGWRTTPAGAVKEVRLARPLLRDRSRDLVRNNAWGARAMRIKVANTVGTGIIPRADTGDQQLNDQIDGVHAEWAAECAPESGGDLYGCQALVDRARGESGEALVLLDRTGSLAPGGVPLALQVVEGDWLADDTDVLGRRETTWRDGIRFDDRGRRVSYRLYRNHPSDVFTFGPNDTRDVPASDLVHLFCQDRPGQIRGVPDMAAVLLRMRDLEDYHDAALLLAKVQAVLGAFVTQPAGPAGSPLGKEGNDAAGNRIEELAPGMIGYLAPGEDVKFLSPQGAGPFAEYTRAALHLIAAGIGITYHQLTGDLREANYSSLRAGSLEFRRQVEQYQHLVLVPMLLRPIWRAFLAQAVLAGRLPAAALNAPAKWTPPRFELVDPIRDTEAIKSQIRAGLMTWPDAVSEMGFDPTAQLAEIATWGQKIRAAGVILDTDPSLTTANGQPVNPAATSSVVLAAEGTANAG
jgi:lambda family phage portal protein